MSEISAYHEAGHAFMAIYVGARVRHVTIEPDNCPPLQKLRPSLLRPLFQDWMDGIDRIPRVV